MPNIYGSKGDQTTKFGQLIEYNTSNIFVEKWHRKCGGDASTGPFCLKKLKLF